MLAGLSLAGPTSGESGLRAACPVRDRAPWDRQPAAFPQEAGPRHARATGSMAPSIPAETQQATCSATFLPRVHQRPAVPT